MHTRWFRCREPANYTALIAALIIIMIVTIVLLILHFASSKIKKIVTPHEDVNNTGIYVTEMIVLLSFA